MCAPWDFTLHLSKFPSQPALEALVRHRDSGPVAAAALSYLRNLSAQEDLRQGVVPCVPSVQVALQRHGDCKDVVVAGLWLLANIASTTRSRPAVMECVAGAVEGLQTHIGCDDVVRGGVQLLFWLSRSGDLLPTLSQPRLGAIRTLTKVQARWTGDYTVTSLCAQALEKLGLAHGASAGPRS